MSWQQQQQGSWNANAAVAFDTNDWAQRAQQWLDNKNSGMFFKAGKEYKFEGPSF
jgi:hypothetical protein